MPNLDTTSRTSTPNLLSAETPDAAGETTESHPIEYLLNMPSNKFTPKFSPRNVEKSKSPAALRPSPTAAAAPSAPRGAPPPAAAAPPGAFRLGSASAAPGARRRPGDPRRGAWWRLGGFGGVGGGWGWGWRGLGVGVGGWLSICGHGKQIWEVHLEVWMKWIKCKNSRWLTVQQVFLWEKMRFFWKQSGRNGCMKWKMREYGKVKVSGKNVWLRKPKENGLVFIE